MVTLTAMTHRMKQSAVSSYNSVLPHADPVSCCTWHS